MHKFLLLLTCLLICCSNTVARPIDDRALVGLNGIGVLFTPNYPKELEADGLTAKQIYVDAQIKLRQAGIKVLEDNEIDKAEGKPIFVFNISATKNSLGLYAISIRLELRQLVTLQRKPALTTMCSTWEISDIVIVGKDNLKQAREHISDGVDMFIYDYLKANPK